MHVFSTFLAPTCQPISYPHVGLAFVGRGGGGGWGYYAGEQKEAAIDPAEKDQNKKDVWGHQEA